MCLAKSSLGNGRRYFLACVLVRNSSGIKGGTGSVYICTKSCHADVDEKGAKVTRMEVKADDERFDILTPIATKRTQQRRCFS